MADDDDTGDDIVAILRELRLQGATMKRRLAALERYLRDEGYGEGDADDLDEDD